MDSSPITDPERGGAAAQNTGQERETEVLWESRIERWKDQVDRGIEENTRMIAEATLDQGWEIAAHRTAIYTPILREFFEAVIEEVPPNGSIVVYQLGGTGRGEMCPDSDLDLGLIIENIDDDEAFLKHLTSKMRQLQQAAPVISSVLQHRFERRGGGHAATPFR